MNVMLEYVGDFISLEMIYEHPHDPEQSEWDFRETLSILDVRSVIFVRLSW